MTVTRAELRSAAVAGLLLAAAALVAAQPVASPIYSCIDSHGRRLTSDRVIAECVAREQRILNADGSVNRVLPPTLTADERAEHEAREREAAAERVARQDAVRRDRNLLARFPNEAAHRKARMAALDDTRNAVRISETRVALLTSERKPLISETEFYPGKTLPAKLKQQLDANDAALEAQQTLIQNQQSEVVRINALYDLELERLKKLWAGAPVGSMGVLPAGAAAPARRGAPR